MRERLDARFDFIRAWVNLFGEQQTTTRAALEFISRALAASEPAKR